MMKRDNYDNEWDGVIFDFDGVLLNSSVNNYRWAHKVREKKARELGLRVPGDRLDILFRSDSFEDFRRNIKAFNLSFQEYKAIEEAVAKKKTELVKENVIDLYPGSKSLLRSLNVPAGLASNAYFNSTDATIREFSLDDYLIDWEAPSLEDILGYRRMMKPNPKMLFEVQKVMDSSNPVMVGDSKSDIEAAKKAGFDSIFIDRGKYKYSVNADYTVSSVRDLFDVFSV